MRAIITGVIVSLCWIILILVNTEAQQKYISELKAEYEKRLEVAQFEADLYKKAVMIIVCESDGIHHRSGRHGEYGLAQFKYETFNRFKHEMGEPQLEWRNKWDQLKVLLWAIANKKENHWTCNKYVE